jgi:uncharacterized protein
MKHLAVLIVALALSAPAQAGGPDQSMPRTLTVTGTGIAKAPPDEASFSTGVVTEAPTAAQALAANSRAMAAVIATLKRQGVPDKAIQTANLSLNPQYQVCKPNMTCPQRIAGYEVSNTVVVTTPLDKAGLVLDALVGAGSNQIGGISFSIHDVKPLIAEARADAVKNAIEKASLYTKAAGVGLGQILSIHEAGAEPPRPMFRAMDKAMASMAVPVAAGEQSVSADVTITWIIN